MLGGCGIRHPSRVGPATGPVSEPRRRLQDVSERLTHVDDSGAARMVDVSGKEITARTATAAGVVRTTANVVELLNAGELKKGDAIATARIAGIMGAKRTPDLVPLCHPIALHKVTVDIAAAGDTIEVTATARTADRTGVEMEALTAVAVAGLTLIDMIKAVDPAASITDVRVLRKEGGRTGLWERDPTVPATEGALGTKATPGTNREPGKNAAPGTDRESDTGWPL